MNLFKRKFQDERVTIEQNKIYREIYLLIYLICLGSVIYKFSSFGIEIQHVVTETIIFLVAGIYYGIRSTQKGLFSSEVEMHDNRSKWSYQTKNIVYAVIFGGLIALFFGFNSAFRYADSTPQAVSYFFITFGATMMFYIPFLVVFLVVSYSIAKSRSDKVIEKQLEDEEE
ncbi:DUF6773 family protein [Gracilibacillus kekensis]|uniref:Uncharacterized protein n=1 Tax=Gracilibacillus kekensis TaxID=1027249 RepID=A0A1M7PY69_9BACI|nr:DUF6773 family protein [Gracilibacillus kekensis]SHN22729.1 hypothetical protein SAMN05216179_2593 [Gracilibacillus kekensis]